jgi:CRISPR-associated protein Csx10
MRLYYTLTTVDPVILSQDNSTTNNHKCLDYIPGSTILGLLAGEHYQHLTKEDSWHVFHSGKCRFSPCYPLLNQEICLPTPASWYFEKGKEVQTDNQLNTKEVSNHAAKAFIRNEVVQYKQCRDGYFNSTGEVPEIKQGLITKTAIDRAKGKAKDTSLFSFSYLEAEQAFAGWIDCADELHAQQIKKTLDQVRRIGRSRNNEFGRVKLSLAELESEPVLESSEQTTLWCLSDCELLDDNGFPCLSPNGKHIHSVCNHLTLNHKKSFIRTNKVRRFNQKREGLDSEQCLIAKGSVLVFDGKLSDEIIKEISEQGIGINKQQGLGWVAVNPLWAAGEKLGQSLFSKLCLQTKLKKPETSVIKAKETLFTQWISEQHFSSKNEDEMHTNVNELLKGIFDFYEDARSYNNILNHLEVGPSSTQWRRIADKVRNTNTNWQLGVFVPENQKAEAKDNFICKPTNDEFGWGINWHDGVKQITFADKVRDTLESLDVFTMRLLLEKLCRYDLSTFQGLKKMEQEILGEPTKEGV